MLLTDANILVHAYRDTAPNHERYRDWLEALINGEEAYGVSDLVLNGFLRIVTNRRVFDPPSPVDDAIIFAEQIRNQPQATSIFPGSRHWGIFTELCRTARAQGNLVPDAYFAALAIESGSEWISDDGDYARFPGLRWRRPF
jgi:toxin-antitoxin system PIN domain toxin